MKLRYISGILAFAASMSFASCDDGEDDVSIYKDNIISTVTTGSAEVTAASATVYGTVLDLSSQSSSAYVVGAYYSTSEASVTSGSKATGSIDSNGAVTTTISGLDCGVTYYYCTFVTLQSSVTMYGEVKSFVTTDSEIATAEAASVTAVSASLGGTMTGVSDLLESGSDALTYGIVISASEDLDEGVTYTSTDATSSFSVAVEKLLPSTTYYYAAYRIMSDITVYGDTKNFTTEDQEMEYVDLGLSVLWAKCNIGATSEEELGGLYGYGDATGLLQSTSIYDYATGQDIAGTEYDVCSKVSGQLPTYALLNELITNCTSEWEEVNGVGGYRFTASNGNSIFLPAAGYREGETTTDEGVGGYYWTGTNNVADTDYSYSLAFSSSSAAKGVSKCSYGLSIRPVAYANATTAGDVTVNNSKVLCVNSDTENGTFRIEIYNAYGSTVSDPGIAATDIAFSENMIIAFTLSGIDNNLSDGAAGTYAAGLEFACNDDWGVGYWSGCDKNKYDAVVTGDGTYVVWWENTTGTAGTYAQVLCVDIPGLYSDLTNPDQVTAKIEGIWFDEDVEQTVNEDILVFGSNDNGDGARLFIYSPWTDKYTLAPEYYDDKLFFTGMMAVDFTINGVDGNLSDSAAGSYSAALSFSDASWGHSWWGGDYGGDTVTGDGSYTVYGYVSGDSEGVVFWCVELSGLYPDLTDPSLVTFSIDKVSVPGKVLY